MKKLLLVQSALMLLPALVRAQEYATDRGALVLDGTAGYSSRSSEGETSTSMLFSPSARYFIRPGLAVGGRATAAYSSQNGFSSTRYGIGPAVTYYFGRGQREFYPFLSANYFLSRASRDAGGGAPDVDLTFTEVELSAGLLLMLARGVGLVGEAYYRRNQGSVDSGGQDFDSRTIGARFGIAAFVF